MTTASSAADERLPTRMPDSELPRAPSDTASGLEEPGLAIPVPNVRLPVWDGKRRTEPGAYKEWKREIKAIQLAYDIQDHRYTPLLFMATKDYARDVLSDLDADNLTSLEMIMSRPNKEFEKPDFEKLDFEKSELAYQYFERRERNPGQLMTSYLHDMNRKTNIIMITVMMMMNNTTKMKSLTRKVRNVPGHALHEKGSQRQRGVGLLVGI